MPPDPSYTDSMTPLVSTTSPTVSAFVGTWRSMTIASSAVMTGIADLHAITAYAIRPCFPKLEGGGLPAGCIGLSLAPLEACP